MQRKIKPGAIYHIYSRGNLKMPLFRCRDDYNRFLIKLSEYKKLVNIQIFAYCLMPNHFHLLIREPLNKGTSNLAFISCFMNRTLTSYSKYFCLKYHHSGHVFQGRFHDKAVDNIEYLKVLVYYIHNNPVRHGLVSYQSDWPYSSAFKGYKRLQYDRLY